MPVGLGMDTSVGPAQLAEMVSVSPSGLAPGPLGPWDAASVCSLPPFTHAPVPVSPFLLMRSSARPPAHCSREADICSLLGPGVGGGAGRPPFPS